MMSVTRQEVRQFTGDLAARMGGVRQSLVGMLTDLAARQSNPELRGAVEQVTQEVRAGQPLSRAMAQHPGIFDAGYVATVRAGERGGNWIRRSWPCSEAGRGEP